MQVFINKEFMDGKKALITPFSGGYMYGYGVFETIKVYNKHILFMQEHFQRLENSLHMLHLDLQYDIEQMTDVCINLIESNSIINGFVKIMCSKAEENKTDTVIYSGNKYYEKHQYQNGFKICLSNCRRNEFSKLCFIKSMNYAENIMQNEFACENGFDEAVFLNTKNLICEGCISNIFWIKDERVHTPSVECGLLAGIARQKTIDLCEEKGIPVNIGGFSLKELENADEIFLTNSLMDIMPVCVFEKKNYDIQTYKFTNALMRDYKKSYLDQN